jgi:hypothetical protein
MAKTLEEQAAQRAAYRAANRDKVYAQKKLYRERNRKAIRLADKAFYQENKEKRRAEKRRYAQENKEELRVKAKAHYAENKEQYSEKASNYYKCNKETVKTRVKRYATENKDKIAASKKVYQEENKERVLAKQAEWYQQNKERIAKKNKQKARKKALDSGGLWGKRQCPLVIARNDILTHRRYYQKNKEHVCAQSKDWRTNNLEKFRLATAKRARDRRKNDLQFKIMGNLRTRINHAVKGLSKKSAKTLDLLGCSVSDLKSYLESKFTSGMTWENYGYRGWHIDHIVPISKFDLAKPEEQKKACHYTNLQPLWWRENIQKGNK